VEFCREKGLIGGSTVALDGTMMRAVASPKNIAWAERLARDIAHTEREIAYCLDRLDTTDEQAAQGFGDQPAHREALADALAALKRRKDRLRKRQEKLAKRAEKVLVFGEPDAKPMGYAHAPKLPSYNLPSVVGVESGLIVDHDVFNDANDSHMLRLMALAAKEVLEAGELHVLTDDGYSNAVVARCEAEAITGSARSSAAQ
jgi:transposase